MLYLSLQNNLWTEAHSKIIYDNKIWKIHRLKNPNGELFLERCNFFFFRNHKRVNVPGWSKTRHLSYSLQQERSTSTQVHCSRYWFDDLQTAYTLCFYYSVTYSLTFVVLTRHKRLTVWHICFSKTLGLISHLLSPHAGSIKKVFEYCAWHWDIIKRKK